MSGRQSTEQKYSDIRDLSAELHLPLLVLISRIRAGSVSWPVHEWARLSEPQRLRVFNFGFTLTVDDLSDVLLFRNRALGRAVGDVISEVVNDCRSYQQFEHKLDQIERVFRAARREHGVTAVDMLRHVDVRLRGKWSAAGSDAGYRQLLLDARQVFERFAARYRLAYSFSELS